MLIARFTTGACRRRRPRSEAISALSDLISRIKGAVSSCMILRSALRSLLSFSACSSLMALTMMPMMRLSTVNVVTTMKEMKKIQA
jgi:hypothetical protein